MFRTKRSMAALLLIAILCGVFLVNFLGGTKGVNEVVVDVKKSSAEDARRPTLAPGSPTADEDSGDEEHDDRVSASSQSDDYCTWSPADQDNCKKILSRRLEGKTPPRRWLFLGDSTVAQFWKTSSLSQVMVDFGVSQINEACSRRYECQPKTIDQCHLNKEYDLPETTPWQLPNWELGEGPANVTDHDCLGCKNCLSSFPFCKIIDDSRHCRGSKKLSYGGYFAIPFARDVLLQTPSFGTTQENILGYIERHWNTPDLHEDFGGHPVCVVRTGFHDIAVPQMTQTKYVSNVQWYLELLLQQCAHVIWLQNTAPLLHDDNPQFPQTVERVRAYDRAVYEMVSSQDAMSDRVTTMDVFQASRDWEHADNIHLSSDWNRALGMFFVKLATKIG